MAELPFEAFDFHGFKGHRRVIYFGARYDFSRGRLDEAGPLPAWLEPLRDRAAAFAGLPEPALAQCLINEYRPGAGIGWHRDRPQFGRVVGVSLASAATMRFRRERPGGGWDRANLPLPPRSAYLLAGPAREDWQHSIAPGDQLRWSVTFRTLR
jgi:alkylated DNA repair protein (DNA oxidative demethylase)